MKRYLVRDMTMSLLPYDRSDSLQGDDSNAGSSSLDKASISLPLHVSREKLQIPALGDLLDRPRVNSLLSNSEQQYPATLMCGRSGTGKTALAARFALSRKNSAWYSLEPPDADWRSFAFGALSSFRGKQALTARTWRSIDGTKRPNKEKIDRFLETLFRPKRSLPSLFILDNVHYLFDAEWLKELFDQFFASIPASTHVLMLSRSKPPNPLWRLRSKQFLNVIDERIFAFNEAETIQLFDSFGLSSSIALQAHRYCFGKVSDLTSLCRSMTKDLSVR